MQIKRGIRNSCLFSISWYFQGNKMVCVDFLVIALSKMKDLCICMWLWTKTWQKCTAAVLCRAVWVDWGSTAVFLSHHYSLFFSASHSSALWLRRSGEINKGSLHSFALKHTLAVPHTQDNVRGSSLNAIRGSKICLTEPQQNNLYWPVKRFENTVVRQEAGEEKQKVEILFLAQVKWTSFSVIATLR